MEFADGQCSECGLKFSGEGPEDSEIIEVKEPYNIHGREVEFVAPCPSCGKNIPLWAGAGALPEPEPTAPEATEPTEPVVEPEPEPASE